MTPDERIARLQALLGRMLTRAGEPRVSSPQPALDASAYDDIQDDVLQDAVDDGVAPCLEVDASLRPISRAPFTPPPPAWGVEAPSASSTALATFDGEFGTLVSRASLEVTPHGEAREVHGEPRTIDSYELDLDAALAAGEVSDVEVELELELRPDDDDHAVKPAARVREDRIEDPQEVTDVFASRSRLVAASRVGSEADLAELEDLGEAEANELSTAIDLEAFGEAPDSTRRPITTPPESGSQIASAPAPALSPSFDANDYSDARAPTPSLPLVTPSPTMVPVAASHVERIAPRLDLEAKVGQIVGAAPAFAPATFGELLEATLDL